MQKKDWYIVVGILVCSIMFDQLSRWVVSLMLENNNFKVGPVGFAILKSAYLIDFIGYKKLLLSCVLSIFFLFLFFVLNFVLIQKLLGLRVGLAFFAVGMLGESVNVILHGSILDWIVIYGRYFNLTDVYVLVGLILTLFFCFRDRSIIFRKNNLRKRMLIEKDQSVFIFYILFSYFVFFIGLGMFFIVFIKMVLMYTMNVSQAVQSDLLTTSTLLFSLLAFCFFIIIAGFAIYISNKIYGPVYAFKKYVNDVFLSGSGADRDYPFKLRKGDHFNDLQDLADQLRDKYGKNQ